MRLIVNRSFDPNGFDGKGTWPYVLMARVELTDEEKGLVSQYKLGDHILTQSQHSMTQLDDLLKGDKKSHLPALETLIGNEQALRDACAQLPAMFACCRSFGVDEIIEYQT